MHVLLFEPECGGHYFQWVSHLIDAFLSRQDRVSLATSAHGLASEEYREYLQRFADRVRIIPIPGSTVRRSTWHHRVRHVLNAIHLVCIAQFRKTLLDPPLGQRADTAPATFTRLAERNRSE